MRAVIITWRQLIFIAAIGGLVIILIAFIKNIDRKATVFSSSNKKEIASTDLKNIRNLVETEKRRDFPVTEKDKEEYRSIDTLLFFVGYSRSRHTLLASLLDGHPHMVVANENNLFTRLTHGAEFNRNEMFDMLMKDSKSFLKGGKGMMMNGTLENTTHFGFWMEGYWQGAYDKYIKVIGDKTAWLTSAIFLNKPNDEITRLVDNTENKYRVKVKFIHIIRNPFDIVSTITLRNTKQQGGRFKDHTDKVDDPELLENSMDRFFRWAEGSAIAREILGDKLLDVNGLELVKNPVESMSKVCQFIDITCSDDFLQACAKVVDPKPSITRHYVVWTKEQMNRMYSVIEQYPFLSHYTFNN